MATLIDYILDLDPLVRECISQIIVHDSVCGYPTWLWIVCEVRPGYVPIPGCQTDLEMVPYLEEETGECKVDDYTLAVERRRIPDLDRQPSPFKQLVELRRSRLCGKIRWRKDRSIGTRNVFWGATTHYGSPLDRRLWVEGLADLLRALPGELPSGLPDRS